MTERLKNSFRQDIAIFAVIFLFLVGGTMAVTKYSTDRVLYLHATSQSQDWASYLAQNVTDLRQIASGQPPSLASQAFLKAAQKSGQVFRYEIFNRGGYSQLVSDRGRIALVDISEFTPEAVRAASTSAPVVDVSGGRVADLPAFYARAYVPVIDEGETIAVVAAYVDQTAERNQVYGAALTEAIALCGLTAVCFGIPVFAWYRRSREKQQAERRIRFLAHHDALTGLANRASLVEGIDAALQRQKAFGDRFAVHMIDLDRFKEVNDTFGHDGGDFLLRTIADRLRGGIRPGDILGRLGGDEFVAIQLNIGSQPEAAQFASRLLATLSQPIVFGEQEIVAAASIGVALAPEDGTTAMRLLKSADLALYQSKAEGRGCARFFRPEMDVALLGRIRLEKAIRRALATDGFELNYQPVFELLGRKLTGFEALIRLNGEDGQAIPPMVFIPFAEELRLIDRIGAWVLGEACRTAMTWPEHLTVAVNLSPGQFAAGSVSQVVAAALRESGLPAHRLELEITETLLLHDSEAVLEELRKIKALGVAIVMDDFGTGYSSLSYLWRFPFDKLKIDQSFTQGFGRANADAETVVRTIMALGRQLKMQVTVEGVETASQLAFLEGASGEFAQGFLFGRPIPATEIAAFVLKDFQHDLPDYTLALGDTSAARAAE